MLVGTPASPRHTREEGASRDDHLPVASFAVAGFTVGKPAAVAADDADATFLKCYTADAVAAAAALLLRYPVVSPSKFSRQLAN